MSYKDQNKTAKKQRQLMDQQIAQNAYLLDKSKKRDESIASAFGPKQSPGLAQTVVAQG